MAYDRQNVFALILRGELPCKKVYEDEHVLAFHDIHPQAPVHILLIPKGARLIGTYDNQVTAGEGRLLVAWTRLILPDGRSLRLRLIRREVL